MIRYLIYIILIIYNFITEDHLIIDDYYHFFVSSWLSNKSITQLLNMFALKDIIYNVTLNKKSPIQISKM